MRILVLTALMMLGASVSLEAAIVYLKDGGQVRGTVVSATAADLKLHTPDGTLTIAAERILRVDYAETPTPAEPPAPPARTSQRPLREIGGGPEPTQMFSLGLGFATPASRVNFESTGGGTASNGDTGLFFGTQYAYSLSPRTAIGFNIEYLGRSPTGSQSLVPETNTDVSGGTFLLMPTVKYAFTSRGNARPYLLAGVGANRTSTVVDATPNVGFGWSDTGTAETRTLVDDSRWGLAYTGRVGIDFLVSEPSVFSLEFGWTGVDNADAEATRAGKDLGLEEVTGNVSAVTFAARWGWRF